MYQSLQGNLGLGKAIAYFTSKGYRVSLPLNDTQKYDLAVDIDGALQRVQVKTSRQLTKSGTYSVQLKTNGGGSKKSVPFDPSSCDYLFVYTADEKTYLIPSSAIYQTSSMRLGDRYAMYEVECDGFEAWISNNAT